MDFDPSKPALRAFLEGALTVAAIAWLTAGFLLWGAPWLVSLLPPMPPIKGLGWGDGWSGPTEE